jgi:hypothetical protein
MKITSDKQSKSVSVCCGGTYYGNRRNKNYHQYRRRRREREFSIQAPRTLLGVLVGVDTNYLSAYVFFNVVSS